MEGENGGTLIIDAILMHLCIFWGMFVLRVMFEGEIDGDGYL